MTLNSKKKKRKEKKKNITTRDSYNLQFRFIFFFWHERIE